MRSKNSIREKSAHHNIADDVEMIKGKYIFNHYDRKTFMDFVGDKCGYDFFASGANNTVWLTADNYTAKATRLYYLEKTPEKFLSSLAVMSFSALLKMLSEELMQIPPIANQTMIKGLIVRAIVEINDLESLNKYKNRFFPGLIDYLYSFRESVLYSTSKFNTNTPYLNMNEILWRDLCKIDAFINDVLTGMKLTDMPNRDILILKNFTKKTWQTLFPKVDKIIIEPESDNNELTLSILKKIMAAVDNVIVYIPYEDDSKVLQTYNEANRVFIEMIKPANHLIPNDSKASHIDVLHDTLKRNLFNINPEASEDTRELIEKRIHIVECLNKIDEAESVAAYIKKIAADKSEGLALSDIVVTSPDLNQYIPALHNAFSMYDIPLTYIAPLPLPASPVGTFIFKIFRCISNNYHINLLRQIFDYPMFLKNISRVAKDEAKIPEFKLSRDIIDDISVSTHVLEGREAWIRELEKLINIIEQQSSVSMDNDEESSDESDKNKTRIYRCALLYLKSFFETTISFEKKMSPDEFSNALQSLFEFLNLRSVYDVNNLLLETFSNQSGDCAREGIWHSKNIFLAELNIRAYQNMTGAIDRIIHSLEEVKTGKQSLAFYEEILNNELQNCNIMLSRKPYSGVKIIPFSRINEFKCRIVISVGMHFDAFPRISGKNPFLSLGESEKKSGESLYASQKNSDRYSFFKLLIHPDEKCFLTYPQRLDDEILPSPFLTELMNIFSLKSKKAFPARTKLPMHIPALLESVSKSLSNASAEFFTQEYQTFLSNDIKNLIQDSLERLDVEIKRKSVDIDAHIKNSDDDYFGILKDAEIKNKIFHRFTNHHFSVSEIDKYVSCPFLFFVEKILKIQGKTELEEDLTPAAKGSLFHNIFFRYYNTLRKEALGNTDIIVFLKSRKIVNLKPTQADFEKKLSLILSIAEEEFLKIPLSGYFWEKQKKDCLATFNKDGYSGILEKYLIAERDNQNALYPMLFELVFGRQQLYGSEDPFSDTSSISIDDTKPAIKISGRIDRVDISQNGEYILIDYKTGKSTDINKIKNGRKYQMPVYIIALEKMLKNKLDKTERLCFGSVFYRISTDKREAAKEKYLIIKDLKKAKTVSTTERSGLLEVDEFDELLETTRQRIRLIVEQIKDAKFPPVSVNPEDVAVGIEWDTKNLSETCEYCNYSNICRRI